MFHHRSTLDLSPSACSSCWISLSRTHKCIENVLLMLWQIVKMLKHKNTILGWCWWWKEIHGFNLLWQNFPIKEWKRNGRERRRGIRKLWNDLVFFWEPVYCVNLYNLNANVKTYKYVLDVGCSLLVVVVDSFCWGSRRRKSWELLSYSLFLCHRCCHFVFLFSFFGDDYAHEKGNHEASERMRKRVEKGWERAKTSSRLANDSLFNAHMKIIYYKDCVVFTLYISF